jgi:hypothetical protein
MQHFIGLKTRVIQQLENKESNYLLAIHLRKEPKASIMVKYR